MPTISKDVLNEKYTQNGLSLNDIAKEFSCSMTRIRDFIIKYNIPIRIPCRHHKESKRQYGKKIYKGKVIEHKKEQNNIEAIKKMYCKEKINPNTIARLLNNMKIPTKRQGQKWRHNTVIGILKREGFYIPTR